MSYASTKEFTLAYDVKTIGQLSNDDGGDAQNDIILQLVLDNASAYIDSYLRKRYTVPVSGNPPELRRACLIVAKHDLEMRRAPVTDEQDKQYDEIVEWLKMVADGSINLNSATVLSNTQAIFSSETIIYDETSFGVF